MLPKEISDRIKTLPMRRIITIVIMVAVVIVGVLVLQMVRAARGFSHTIEVVALLDSYSDTHHDWPNGWEDLGCDDLSGYVTIDFSVSSDAIVKDPTLVVKAVKPLYGSLDNMPEQEEILTEVGRKIQYKRVLQGILDRLRDEGNGVSKADALEIAKLVCDYKYWGWMIPGATRDGATWVVKNTTEPGGATVVVDAMTGKVLSEKQD